MKILFLFTKLSGFKRSNHLMFHNAFLHHGWRAHIGRVDSLALENGKIWGDVCATNGTISPGDDYEDRATYKQIADYDLIWVMNQPHWRVSRDIFEILWMLSRRCEFVNSVEAMVFLNNKNVLSDVLPSTALIDSFSSASAARLCDLADDGHTWVVKPTNDGNGTNVFVLRPGDTNKIPLLQSVTGNETTQVEIHGQASLGLIRTYSLLQKFVPEAREREKRVVIAGGRTVHFDGVPGVYQTVFRTNDHRSNRIHTPEKLSVSLTAEEEDLCSELGKNLLSYGIRMAAIDMCFPKIFEINLVNPGGLQTVDLITGKDLTPAAVEQILAAISSGESFYSVAQSHDIRSFGHRNSPKGLAACRS